MASSEEMMGSAEEMMARSIKNNPTIYPLFGLGMRNGRQVYHLIDVYKTYGGAAKRIRELWERGKIAFFFSTKHETPGVPAYQDRYGDFKAITYNREALWHTVDVEPLPFYRRVRTTRKDAKR